MDIYSFIKSKDVVKHLKKIDYKFTSCDAAVAVYGSDKTLREKHDAYREIIETMPDCIFDVYGKKRGLHDCLNRLTDEQNELIEMFYRKEDATSYDVNLSFTSYEQSSEYDISGKRFADIDSCFAEIDKCPQQYINHIRISKHFDNSCDILEICFTLSHEILEINTYGELLPCDNALGILDFIDSDIPSPFKKGDIVCYLSPDWMHFDNEIFVISDITENGIELFSKDHVVFFSNPLSLEYCTTKEVNFNMRLLYAVSAYIKGKLRFYEFLRAYECCVAEETLENKMHILDDNIRKLLKYKSSKQSKR